MNGLGCPDEDTEFFVDSREPLKGVGRRRCVWSLREIMEAGLVEGGEGAASLEDDEDLKTAWHREKKEKIQMLCRKQNNRTVPPPPTHTHKAVTSQAKYWRNRQFCHTWQCSWED